MYEGGLYQFIFSDEFDGTEKSIEFSTRRETISEIGKTFGDFLMACGFCVSTIKMILPNTEE